MNQGVLEQPDAAVLTFGSIARSAHPLKNTHLFPVDLCLIFSLSGMWNVGDVKQDCILLSEETIGPSRDQILMTALLNSESALNIWIYLKLSDMSFPSNSIAWSLLI